MSDGAAIIIANPDLKVVKPGTKFYFPTSNHFGSWLLSRFTKEAYYAPA